jgi:hypothetical protein
MELALMRSLLDRDFYELNKALVKSEIFSDEVNKIKAVLDKAHTEYARNLSVSELEAVFTTSYPAMTTAQRNQYKERFNNMRSEQALGSDLAAGVIRDLWRQCVAEELANHAFDMVNGKVKNMSGLRDMVAQYEDDFMPTVRVDFDNTDIDYVLEQVNQTFKWRINIPTVAELWPGVNEGQLIVGAARPNTGKTSSIAHLVSGVDGFIDQGATVMVLANEEATNRVTSRHMSAATSLNLGEITDKRNRAFVDMRIGRDSNWQDKFKITDATTWDLDRMEAVIKRVRPDIVICDMADKFLPSGNYTAAHEALKATYIRFRIIGKQYGCCIFAMSQMSAEAEGRTMVNQSMLEGSKTGKAAEADIMFCLTKNPMIEGQDTDDNERHWVLVKNKLTGRHGMVHTFLDPKTATFSV